MKGDEVVESGEERTDSVLFYDRRHGNRHLKERLIPNGKPIRSGSGVSLQLHEGMPPIRLKEMPEITSVNTSTQSKHRV